jgi:hypothetical protein
MKRRQFITNPCRFPPSWFFEPLTLLNPEAKSFIPVVIHSSATDGVTNDIAVSCEYSV